MTKTAKYNFYTMNIIESIAPFDIETRKGFDFHHIEDALATVDDVEKTKPEFVYEIIAMKLVILLWSTIHIKKRTRRTNVCAFPK